MLLYRLKQNLTQANLAKRLGVSVPTVSGLENGKNTSLETFIRTVFALGLQAELQELFTQRALTIAEATAGVILKQAKPCLPRK